jgi:hypothetical protein
MTRPLLLTTRHNQADLPTPQTPTMSMHNLPEGPKGHPQMPTAAQFLGAAPAHTAHPVTNATGTARPAPAAPVDATDDPHAVLRGLGGRAHQVHACIRAADRYNANPSADDRTTAAWLMSSALGLATDLSADTDRLARRLRETAARSELSSAVTALRQRAYQVQAVTRAADHFLEQDNAEDQENGNWLVATALGLSQRLAADLDDHSAPPRRQAAGRAVGESLAQRAVDVQDAQDAALARRMAAATTVPGVGRP